jgi:hypothetical protein
MGRLSWAFMALLPLAAACDQEEQPVRNTSAIEVRGEMQDKLHTLSAVNLAIALKRAIYDLGYTCQRIDKAGFVGRYQTSDMWTAHCSDGRDWAIFASPDGSVQVRDCKDLPGTGVPECKISKLPEGSFEGEARKPTRAAPLPG